MSGGRHDPFEDYRKRKAEKNPHGRKDLPDSSLGRISDYFSKVQETAPRGTAADGGDDEKTPEKAPGEAPVPAASSAVRRLEALTELLLAKGLITEDELLEVLNRES